MSDLPTIAPGGDALRNAYDLYKLAWELAHAEPGDLAGAIRAMESAVQLEPRYEGELISLRWFVDRKARGVGKVSLSSAIDKVLTPLLRAEGFTLILPLEGEQRSWKEGCIFQRVQAGKHQDVTVAGNRHGGKRLWFSISAETAPGAFLYRDNRDFDTPHERLSYLNQNELEAVCRLLANLLRTAILPWLEQL